MSAANAAFKYYFFVCKILENRSGKTLHRIFGAELSGRFFFVVLLCSEWMLVSAFNIKAPSGGAFLVKSF